MPGRKTHLGIAGTTSQSVVKGPFASCVPDYRRPGVAYSGPRDAPIRQVQGAWPAGWLPQKLPVHAYARPEFCVPGKSGDSTAGVTPLLQPLRRGIERCQTDTQSAGGPLLDELADSIAVALAGLDQGQNLLFCASTSKPFSRWPWHAWNKECSGASGEGERFFGATARAAIGGRPVLPLP